MARVRGPLASWIPLAWRLEKSPCAVSVSFHGGALLYAGMVLVGSLILPHPLKIRFLLRFFPSTGRVSNELDRERSRALLAKVIGNKNPLPTYTKKARPHLWALYAKLISPQFMGLGLRRAIPGLRGRSARTPQHHFGRPFLRRYLTLGGFFISHVRFLAPVAGGYGT